LLYKLNKSRIWTRSYHNFKALKKQLNYIPYHRLVKNAGFVIPAINQSN